VRVVDFPKSKENKDLSVSQLGDSIRPTTLIFWVSSSYHKMTIIILIEYRSHLVQNALKEIQTMMTTFFVKTLKMQREVVSIIFVKMRRKMNIMQLEL
jgi:hypothetical protein